MTILTTSRCTLRPFTKEDAESLTTIVGSDAVMRYSMTGVLDTVATAEMLSGWLALYGSGYASWAVLHDGKLIGYAGLDSREIEGHARVQITFRLAEPYWGLGLATEIAQAVKDYAVSHQGLTEIVALVDPENLASIRVLEKIGMGFDRQVVYGGLALHLYGFER